MATLLHNGKNVPVHFGKNQSAYIFLDSGKKKYLSPSKKSQIILDKNLDFETDSEGSSKKHKEMKLESNDSDTKSETNDSDSEKSGEKKISDAELEALKKHITSEPESKYQDSEDGNDMLHLMKFIFLNCEMRYQNKQDDPDLKNDDYNQVVVIHNVDFEIGEIVMFHQTIKDQFYLEHPLKIIGPMKNDFFFLVHREDTIKLSCIKRFQFGMRWIEDVYANGHKKDYPKWFTKRYPGQYD